MRPRSPSQLLRTGILDARTTALIWLLADGGVPLVLAGSAAAPERAAVAAALLGMDPRREWVLIDAETEPLRAERLAAHLRGGVRFAISLEAADLGAVLERLAAMSLPEDGIRRLGVIAILEAVPAGLRCTSVHYLRPAERDAQGHVQRRPPAVLAAWDERGDTFEDFAWGITPELADRVDRAQADLEERQAQRARFLERALADERAWPELVRDYLASEPPPTRAPRHDRANPSPFSGGLIDPDAHRH